ncbi:putative reverse transcriptase domain-containing protein [Tanacetum coccineum]
METELMELDMKNNDLAALLRRFQDLTMCVTRMVPDSREDPPIIERYVETKMLKGYAIRSAENKRKFESNQRDNRAQQPPFKRQNVRGSNVARAYTAGGNEGRVYVGPHPLCNNCKLHHVGPCTVKCRNYGRQGHFKKDCPKLKNQNHGNKPIIPEARGKLILLENVNAAIAAERARQANVRNDVSRSGPAMGRDTAPAVHECTFARFMKCNPAAFRGVEGAVELRR